MFGPDMHCRKMVISSWSTFAIPCSSARGTRGVIHGNTRAGQARLEQAEILLVHVGVVIHVALVVLGGKAPDVARRGSVGVHFVDVPIVRLAQLQRSGREGRGSLVAAESPRTGVRRSRRCGRRAPAQAANSATAFTLTWIAPLAGTGLDALLGSEAGETAEKLVGPRAVHVAVGREQLVVADAEVAAGERAVGDRRRSRVPST